MTTRNQPRNFANLRIILSAMILGILMFSGIVVMLISSPALPVPAAPAPVQDKTIFWMILGMLTLSLPFGFAFARQGIIRAARNAASGLDSSPLSTYVYLPEISAEPRTESNYLQAKDFLPAFFTITLIGAAMAEGLGMAATVFALVTDDLRFLIAPAVAAGVMLMLFPTQSKLQSFAQSITGRLLDT